MYLNGLDTLGRFTGVRGQNARFDKTNNLFSYNRSPNSVEHSSIKYGDGPYRSMYIPNQLGEAIKAKTPMKAFVCVNNDPNNMHMIEFEEMANDGKFTFSVGYNYYGLTIFQKGVNNDNKVIAVFFDKLYEKDCKIYRLKKAGTNQYITNDMFNTTKTDSYIFITANQPTIDHLNKTPLKTVWTEIQDVLAHKEDYEAYREY